MTRKYFKVIVYLCDVAFWAVVLLFLAGLFSAVWYDGGDVGREVEGDLKTILDAFRDVGVRLLQLARGSY